MGAILQINNISIVYSDVIQVLRGVSLKLEEKKITALLGSNGAGKTSTLRAISGLLLTEKGKVIEGEIIFEGRPIHNSSPEEITRSGIIQVLEGREPFKHLTVEENLKVGRAAQKGASGTGDLNMVYEYFPALHKRRKSLAGYCSGGELQMMVIGRALIARPKILLLDEPSLGLAPMIVEEIFQIVERINREQGTTILLVEQNARAALGISHFGYIMENGRIVMEGTAAELVNNPDIKEFYLGMSSANSRRNYLEIKSYRRRKRWL